MILAAITSIINCTARSKTMLKVVVRSWSGFVVVRSWSGFVVVRSWSGFVVVRSWSGFALCLLVLHSFHFCFRVQCATIRKDVSSPQSVLISFLQLMVSMRSEKPICAPPHRIAGSTFAFCHCLTYFLLSRPNKGGINGN